MILSVEYLSRNLKITGFIIGFIFLIWGFSVFVSPIPQGSLLSFATSPATPPLLIVGMIYFALASGVSKKERWAWVSGLIFFSLVIIYSLTVVLLRLTFPLQAIIIGLLIPILFLFSFIKGSKEITVNTSISGVSFVLAIIGILLIVVSLVQLALTNPKL